MRTVRGRWIVIAITCSLLAVSIPPGTATAAKKKDVLKPGVDKNFAWQRIGFNEARQAGKPIFLYVYDPMDGKPSDPVKKVQTEIFANAGVKAALAEFTPVMQSNTATNWPPAYTAPAKNGVALFFMTCDGRPAATFTHRNMPKAVKDKDGNDQYPLLQAAAAAVVKANPVVAERMKANPPKEYVSPEELAARREAAALPAEPAEKKEESAANLLGPEENELGKREKPKPKPPAEEKKPARPAPIDETE